MAIVLRPAPNVHVSLPLQYKSYKNFSFLFEAYGGPDSSVGIATDYWLDGPGSNPGKNEIFLPSRPALGPPSLL